MASVNPMDNYTPWVGPDRVVETTTDVSAPDQGWNPHPMKWKASPNHFIAKEVQEVVLILSGQPVDGFRWGPCRWPGAVGGEKTK